MERGPTSQLWDDGVRSSYFLLVKMSMATKWHLAWPCLPVLEVDTSATCSARTTIQQQHANCHSLNSSCCPADFSHWPVPRAPIARSTSGHAYSRPPSCARTENRRTATPGGRPAASPPCRLPSKPIPAAIPAPPRASRAEGRAAGGRHLAGAALDDKEAVLADGAGLLGEGEGGARVGVLEVDVVAVVVVGVPHGGRTVGGGGAGGEGAGRRSMWARHRPGPPPPPAAPALPPAVRPAVRPPPPPPVLRCSWCTPPTR